MTIKRVAADILILHLQMHPRNFRTSLKESNSTVAPRSILRGDPPTIGKIPKFKPKVNPDAKSGKLEFTIEGDQISPGSVRDFSLY